MSSLTERSAALSKQFRVSDRVAAILSRIESQAGVQIEHGQPSIFVLNADEMKLSAQNIRDGVLRVFCASRFLSIQEVTDCITIKVGTAGRAYLETERPLDEAVDYLLEGKKEEAPAAMRPLWNAVD